MNKEQLKNRIQAAAGRIPADLILLNCRIVNVYSAQIMPPTDITVKDGVIVRLGKADAGDLSSAASVIDAKGLYAAPGYIDSHIHIESSMVTPEEISRLAVPCGTSTIIADPHEIVNVAGLRGFEYMLKAAQKAPLDIRYMLPSCVPATCFEHSGATVSAKDMTKPLCDGRSAMELSHGLGEFMDYVGVTNADDEALDKLMAAYELGKTVDGHTPGLSGRVLDTYLASGIHTDHECSDIESMKYRLERGMYVILREGTACHDLLTLLQGVTEQNSRRCVLCSDDRQAATFLEKGSLNQHLQMCVGAGIDPVCAIRMATLNAAECFRLYDRGAIAPGLRADIVLLQDLVSFKAEKVFIEGTLVAENGNYLPKIERVCIDSVSNSMQVKPFTQEDLKLHLKGDKAYTITLCPGGVLSKKTITKIAVKDGDFAFDPSLDVVKVVVMERHHATGNIGIGLLKGYGMKRGAIALSIAHDSHNIIAVGVNNQEIEHAIHALIKQEGGMVLVDEGKVLGSMPLPVAGLMSDRSAEWVSEHFTTLRKLGYEHFEIDPQYDPIMTLCFMSLAVIPELKLTDMGLFDVTQFNFINIEPDEPEA